MLFKRRNPAGRTFVGGQFKITRPSGPKLSRTGLAFRAKGADYDVRCDGEEIWLIDGDRAVGYANGNCDRWHLLIDDRQYAIDQPKLGNNFSVLTQDDQEVGTIRGGGFPLRSAQLESSLELSDEQQGFVVMIALLGWRECDRALLGNVAHDQ